MPALRQAAAPLATLLVLILVPAAPSSQMLRANLGVFEGSADVGAPRRPGAAAFDAATGEYRVTGSGPEALHLAWRRLEGDFILTARGRFAAPGGDAQQRLGWIARAGLAPTAPFVAAEVHGDGRAVLRYRRTDGAAIEETRSPVAGADVIQLERRGDTFTMSVAKFGDLLASEKVSEITLGDHVHVGLFAGARGDASETAIFRDVRITIPAREGFVPYRDYIGSRLELVEVVTGAREVIYTDPGSIQAPNWTPDGTALIYNRDGRLFRFDLATRRSAEIDTDFATSNNNDHVLSFDGKMMGISHHSSTDDGRSIVYVLPATGGRPRRVTTEGPSYLHGWSPDGKFLVYTGERGGEFDIYKIPVEGGREERLTMAQGLDDGSEYTPDGKHIYFNSVRSGPMQIWRMRPDGSDQVQVTNDGLNNWFPHISPDGRSIVFLTYGRDTAPDDHPFYRQVYLRWMPVSGGAPRVIAYVYGGQGTINVPSWSPDGKKVAFVSNSDPY